MRVVLASLGVLKLVADVARRLSDFIDPPVWPSKAQKEMADTVYHLASIMPPPGCPEKYRDAYLAGVGDAIAVLRERAGLKDYGPGEGMRTALQFAHAAKPAKILGE